MKQTIIAIICVAFLALSCKETAQQATPPSPMKAVMAVHDELMPKMGEMGSLIEALKTKADTITVTGKQHLKAQSDLKDGYDSMMTWMMDFGKNFNAEEIHKGKTLTPEKLQLLDQEMVKVNALKDKMLGSIDRAKKLLGTE